jgi:hypothetical protein
MYSSDSESDSEPEVIAPQAPTIQAPANAPVAKRKYVRKEMTPEQKANLVARLQKAREAKAQKKQQTVQAPQPSIQTPAKSKTKEKIVHVTNNYYANVPEAVKPVQEVKVTKPKEVKPKGDLFTAKPASRYSAAIW